MFQQTIKANILTIFLLLIALIAGALLSSQYYFNKKLAINEADKNFKIISQNVIETLNKESLLTNNMLQANADNSYLKQKITFNTQANILDSFTQMMRINSDIYSIYFAQSDAHFYEIVNMKESPLLYTHFKAPKETRWLTITTIDNITQYRYLDKNRQELSKRSFKNIYDPLERIWYKNALETKDIQATEPYLFSNLKKMGTTYSLETEQNGTVLAIDFTMKNINQLLHLQKFNTHSEIYIFNTEGKKIASSNSDAKRTIEASLLKKLLQTADDNSVIKYQEENTNYFLISKALKNKNLYLAISVDSNVLLKPFIKNLQYSFLLALTLLILSIPLIFLATGVIVKPIRALIIENEKIKNREFDQVQSIESNILEFIALSDSFVLMSESIQSYQKSQEEMLDAIVKLIAEAVDAKSHYTGGHCERVPEIAQMLIEEASRSNSEVFKEFKLETKDALREFEIGAWLHDCGKVTTPEYVVDKSTKLETINNRIHEVRTRFEVLWRDAQIEYLEAQLKGIDKASALETLNTKQKKLLDDFSFVATCNIGGEFMSEDKQNRIKEIAKIEWTRHFDNTLGLGEEERLRYDTAQDQTLPAREKLLSDQKQHLIKREHFDYQAYERAGFKGEVPEYLYNYGEVYNLCIAKGTLSEEERYKINEHVIMSIKMLEKIPFPAHMRRIPEYAGTHHETLIGTGYPRALDKSALSIPARIMAIADVFEALTASDRPYKKAKTLSESIKILSFMVKDQHLDADLFKLFLSSGLYKVYAKKYLKEEQIDEVDIAQYLLR